MAAVARAIGDCWPLHFTAMTRLSPFIALVLLSVHVSGRCEDDPLGLAGGTVPDKRLVPSSSGELTPAKNARLGFTAASSWCARDDDPTPYLQIDLGSLSAVCAIATQGNSQADEWVDAYQIKTSSDGTTWADYQEGGDVRIFQGNHDRNSVVRHVLHNSLVSRYVRVRLKEWHALPCMRVELYGSRDTSCRATAVGVADRAKIPNRRMTATSYYGDDYVPSNGRLRVDYCWTPNTRDNPDDFLQVDLGGVQFICALATQGNSKTVFKDWTKKYRIALSVDNFSWSTYTDDGNIKIFNGNTDSTTVKENSVASLPRAKFIRFQPTKSNDWPSLRVEVYGALKGCTASLGMEDGSIKNSQISAQSNTNFAKYGRLYSSSAWCSNKKESGYLQIDLGKVHSISGVATQGDPSRNMWVKSYMISYAVYNTSHLNRYKLKGKSEAWKTFDGNNDNNNIRVNWLPVPIVARYIRVVASTWRPSSSGPCLRIDLYGCTELFRPRVSLTRKILTPTKGSFVDVTCNVTSQPHSILKWVHNAQIVTSLSAGVVSSKKDVDGQSTSKLRVNFTSVDDIVAIYNCVRVNMSSRAVQCFGFGCEAFYAGQESETIAKQSAGVIVTLYVPGVPLSVGIQGVQGVAVTVNWKKPSQGQHEGDIASYLIRYNRMEDPHNVTLVKAPAGARAHHISGLAPYTNYSVQIAANSTVGMGLWSKPLEFTTLSVLPEEAPLLLSVVVMTSEKIRIQWKEPGRVNGPLLGYIVSYKAVGGVRRTKSVKGRTSTVELDSLKKWTAYKVKVRVFNDKGGGPWSDEKTVRTKEDAPGSPPSSVSVEVTSSTSAHISWQLPPEDSRNGLIRGFKFTYWKEHRDSSETITIKGNTTLELSLGNLSIFTEYAYQISAYTIADGKSSEPERFTTREDAPSAPRNLIGRLLPPATGSSPKVNLTWERPAEENGFVRKYLLYVSDNETSNGARLQLDPSDCWYLMSVYGRTSYTFRLSGFTIKEGPKTTVQQFVIPEYAPSSPPGGVAVEDYNATTFNVSWQPLSRSQRNGIIIAYEVKYVPEERSLDSNNSLLINTTGNSVLLLDLVFCTRYFVTVRAYTRVGPGPHSDPFSKFSSAPSAPRDFVSVWSNATVVRLKWLRPAYFNGVIHFYTISFRGNKEYNAKFATVGHITVRNGDLTESSVSGLVPATKYEFHITATTTCGRGSDSNAAFEITQMAEPQAPRIPRVMRVNSTGAPVNISVWPADDINGPISTYQIIVLRTEDEKSTLAADYPSHLGDYEHSTETESGYYITAELTADSVGPSPGHFTLGDGHRYGQYVNTALLKGRVFYKVYERAVSRRKETLLVGKESLAAIVTMFEVEDVPTNRALLESDANGTAIAVGIVLGVAILAAALLAIVIIRRRLKAADDTKKRTRKLQIRWSRKTPKSVSSTNLLAAAADGSSVEIVRGEMQEIKEMEEERAGEGEGDDEEKDEDSVTEEQNEKTISVSPSALVAAIGEGEFDPGDIYSEATDGTPKPIPVGEFREYLASMRKHGNVRLNQEYKKLPNSPQGNWSVARLPANKPKNRYGNIVTYDHSRVVLESVPGVKCSDYINASYLKGYDGSGKAYIATQGPNLATLNDFWRMIWQEQVSTVVMLTNLMEKGKRKCHQYWPDKKQIYGQILVTSHKTEVFADFTIRTFSVTHREAKQERQVRQFHFTSWPDKGVPQHATAVLGFRRRVRASVTTGPTVVHCSAGVGRTGAYIVIDAMLDRAKKEGTVDIYNYVRDIRSERMCMIQTVEQYTFVHVAILETWTCGNTEIAAPDLTMTMSKLSAVIPALNITGYQAEFERLQLVSSYVEQDRDVAQRPGNAAKNRYQASIPLDYSRVRLKADKQGHDYINASFADAFRERNAFVMTQAPLECTVNDFWRMALQYRIGTVVMLNNPQEGGQSFPQYWPDDGSKVYGNTAVEFVSMNSREDVEHRTFWINALQDSKRKQKVEHFQHACWPNKGTPSNLRAVLDLLLLVQRSQQNAGNAPMLVQCSNGVGRSGTFCAAYSLIEKLKLEQVVDVLQIVKILRVKRPGAVEELGQYRFCYMVAQEYLDSFSDYSNF